MFVIGVLLVIAALLFNSGSNSSKTAEYKRLSKTCLPTNPQYEKKLEQKILETPLPEEYKPYLEQNIAALVCYRSTLLNDTMIQSGYSPLNYPTMSTRNPNGTIFDPTKKEVIWGRFDKLYKPCIEHYNRTGEFYQDADLLPSETDIDMDKIIKETINEHIEKKTN